MRIVVDVPKSEIELMDETVRKLNMSRAEFIRQAITASLAPYRHKMNHGAFGSWSKFAEEGLAYQERIRAEW